MRRIYSSLRPIIEQKSYTHWIGNSAQKLSLSSRGLVAFTSSFCLNQSRPTSINYHVYVADLNRPYQPYLLTESGNEYILIEWDQSGTKLLVADSQGTVTIYTTKDFLISNWKHIFKHTFSAETFLTSLWYHSGLISTINVANQDLKNPSNHLEYSDKIQQCKFGASLRLFGGKAAEGCILISRTGLIVCLTLMFDGSVDVVVESLGQLRTRLGVADISYHRDGSFVVGSSSGSVNSIISFHQVILTPKSITLDDVDSFMGNNVKRINVVCKQYNSFHLNVMSQMLDENENTSAFEKVKQIKFVTRDSSNGVLIEVSGPNLSLIELWELEAKQKVPIHSAILELKNSTTKTASMENTVNEDSIPRKWSFKGNYITDKNLNLIQVPRFRLFGSNRQLNIILLAYNDSTICCLRKDDLQPIDDTLDLCCALYSPSAPRTTQSDMKDSKSPYKVYSTHQNILKNMIHHRPLPNTKVNSQQQQQHSQQQQHQLLQQQKHLNYNKLSTNRITDLQFSSNQTIFVAIDSMSQLHVVKLPPLIQCQDSRDEETYLQYILEYCLVTGNDWWDVIVCTPSESIDTICDKFHDAYERQPKHIQRMYFNRQLMIRASLYRCLNSVASLCKSSDCHTMIMLNSVSCTIKSMLRQSSDHQDSPAEQLATFLKTQGTQATYFNYSNVISKINEKEYYVEVNLIQCLQPLIQWVVDFSIFLIASFPQRTRSQSMLPGAGLGKNKEALESLRELLIIAKIWSLQNEASSPIVYKLNEQIDVIATLYKLISVYYTHLVSNSQELDGQFLEECVQFTNNITVTQFCYFLAATGIASPLMHYHYKQQHQSKDKMAPKHFEQPSGDNHQATMLLEYFHEPVQPELVSLDKVDGSIDMVGGRRMDVVRNISLGAHAITSIRHCTRCNAVSLIAPPASASSSLSTALVACPNNQAASAVTAAGITSRVWEQRWMNTCICGGSWAQSNSMFGGAGGGISSGCNKISAYHLAWLQGAQASPQTGPNIGGGSGSAVASVGVPNVVVGGNAVLGHQLAAAGGHQLVR